VRPLRQLPPWTIPFAGTCLAESVRVNWYRDEQGAIEAKGDTPPFGMKAGR
jgi:hypothetical protein